MENAKTGNYLNYNDVNIYAKKKNIKSLGKNLPSIPVNKIITTQVKIKKIYKNKYYKFKNIYIIYYKKL